MINMTARTARVRMSGESEERVWRAVLASVYKG